MQVNRSDGRRKARRRWRCTSIANIEERVDRADRIILPGDRPSQDSTLPMSARSRNSLGTGKETRKRAAIATPTTPATPTRS